MGLNLALFARQLTIFSGLLFLIYGLLALILPEKYTSKAFWGFIPFFYTVVLLSKAILNKLTAKNKKIFSLAFVRINVFRFMLYIGVLLLYAFSFPDDAMQFILTFFVFYFAYTIFEVTALYRDMKSEQ